MKKLLSFLVFMYLIFPAFAEEWDGQANVSKLTVHNGAVIEGNVGIGTTSATVALDVVGDVKVSGTVTADSFVGTDTGETLENISTQESVDLSEDGFIIFSGGGGADDTDVRISVDGIRPIILSTDNSVAVNNLVSGGDYSEYAFQSGMALRETDSDVLSLLNSTGDTIAYIANGSSDADISYIMLNNEDGEVCYIYPNATQDGIVVSAVKP